MKNKPLWSRGRGFYPSGRTGPPVSPVDCKGNKNRQTSEKLYSKAVWKKLLRAGWMFNHHSKQTNIDHGSHGDWKTWKMKMVLEKSWNMTNWPKVMEFCDQSWNFTNFAPKLYQICSFFVTSKKLSSVLESAHFLTFSAKCKCKIRKRDGHEKSRNGHGKVMGKYLLSSL